VHLGLEIKVKEYTLELVNEIYFDQKTHQKGYKNKNKLKNINDSLLYFK
jgi:hypothetical protein